MELFSLEDVKDAYLKLKHYIYYDKAYFFNRKKLVEFEREWDIYDENIFLDAFDDINNSQEELFWNRLTNKINEIYTDDLIFNKYLSKIAFNVLPKKVLTQKECNLKEASLDIDETQLISNRNVSKRYIIEDVNFYIDMPIILQILDVLWIVKCGYVLENDKCIYVDNITDEYCYSNKLYLDDNGQVKIGRNLFKNYFNQYPKWRDNAINEVEKLRASGRNALIISLDITKYYYHIDLKYKEVFNTISSKIENFKYYNLNDKIKKIHDRYRELIKKYYNINEDLNNNFLPIGMLSSNILANYYLKSLDKKVINNIRPCYYGRYVDDLLFVFENKYVCEKDYCPNINCPIDNELSDSRLINHFLSGIIEEDKKDHKTLLLKDFPNLTLQKNKIKMFLVDASAPNVVLEQFKNNLAATTSQFQFLPDDKEIDEEYTKQTFFVHYTDSVNKLRSVEKYTIDKYSTSVLLAKKIQIAKYLKSNILESNVKKIINNYFNGKYCLILNSLWHKLFAYLFILNQEYSKKIIIDFYEYSLKNIDKIQTTIKDNNKNFLIGRYLKNSMRETLKMSLALAGSLNLSLLEKLSGKIDDFENIYNLAQNFKYSNMFFHDYIGVEAYNYTNAFYEELNSNENLKEISVTEILKSQENLDLNINNKLVELSPIHVRIEDLNLLKFYSHLNTTELSTINNKIAEEFYEICQNRYKNNININTSKTGSTRFLSFNFKYKKNKNKFIIGISNIHIKEENIFSAIQGTPNLSENRYSQIREIITQAQKNNVDLLVFPELSIPIEWMQLIQKHLKNKNMGIIFGLEHIIVNNKNNKLCGNFLITMLPVKFKTEDGEKTTFMFTLPRLKYFYAPEETQTIEDNRLDVPSEITDRVYYIFKWNGAYFSAYNCFEIACIEDRSIMKSQVDFLTISEWNKDTTYYDNIVHSAARDLHCYVVQVNTSKYGHSCLVAPKKSVESNPVFIKGGNNATLLATEIEIEKLRNFQRTLGRNTNEFKPLPPTFNHNVERLQE